MYGFMYVQYLVAGYVGTVQYIHTWIICMREERGGERRKGREKKERKTQ